MHRWRGWQQTQQVQQTKKTAAAEHISEQGLYMHCVTCEVYALWLCFMAIQKGKELDQWSFSLFDQMLVLMGQSSLSGKRPMINDTINITSLISSVRNFQRLCSDTRKRNRWPCQAKWRKKGLKGRNGKSTLAGCRWHNGKPISDRSNRLVSLCWCASAADKKQYYEPKRRLKVRRWDHRR